MTRRPVEPQLTEPAPDLDDLRRQAAGCQACGLWRAASQTVFGEGPAEARLVLVGEQPGDREDLTGRPFVGPAGTVLDEALAQAGVERAEVYLTNAVKHFKWRPRGARRIHDRPSWSEIGACRPWLEGELAALQPRVVVALGATAAQGFLGRSVRIGSQRGQAIEGTGIAPYLVVTIHPSAVLRLRDRDDRQRARAGLVADLRLASQLAERAGERRAGRGARRGRDGSAAAPHRDGGETRDGPGA